MMKIEIEICGVKAKRALQAAAKGETAYVGFNLY